MNILGGLNEWMDKWEFFGFVLEQECDGVGKIGEMYVCTYTTMPSGEMNSEVSWSGRCFLEDCSF